jgi:hypothetical protein
MAGVYQLQIRSLHVLGYTDWMLLAGVLATAAPRSFAQDVVTVGTGSAAPGTTIDIPVSIRDVSGTSLGLDQPPGARIQAYSLLVNYSPAAAVQSVTFARAGITAPLTPVFESSPSGPGSISLIDTFQESPNLIPFTLNATAPGNQVATLHVTISPSATVGSTITLTLDSTLTQLANQAGTMTETVAGGEITLVAGSISVPVPVPALSLWGKLLAVAAMVVIAIACMYRYPSTGVSR